MSNDDRLVPRDYPIPVSVRRPLAAPLDPALAPSPQGGPPSQSPAHVVYINNMPAPPPAVNLPAASVSAPVAPVIHHHYYNSQETPPRISVRIAAPPANSALGMAALALGIIACVICWVPWLGLIAVPVGAIGAVLGVLGVLASLLFRRSSAGLPLAAIFVCCLAAAISIASTQSLPFWRRQLNRTIDSVLPKNLALPLFRPTPTAPVSSPPPAASPGLFEPSPMPAAQFQTAPPQTATPRTAAPPAAAARASTPPPNGASKMDPSILMARNQLTAAERGCDARTMQTPEYQAAVKAAADARSHAALLRQSSPPGSEDLKQASQAMIDADNAVNQILTRAQANDPEVIAAQQNLAAAGAAH
jgi:hypothetical protein